MIYSVYDKEFGPYGRVIEGFETECSLLCRALLDTPLPDGTDYVPSEPKLEELSCSERFMLSLYGGMDAQLGWCNGHNTMLNCLEYHRDSEFNLGTGDFVLLLAKQDEISNGTLDTSAVKAFLVPGGVLVECYATTLHYAPCEAKDNKGFRVMVALPKGTNTEKPVIECRGIDDKLLWARNKWLLAHAEASEAAQGAYVGLIGANKTVYDYM